jgi:predicted nucleic acid-binding protein
VLCGAIWKIGELAEGYREQKGRRTFALPNSLIVAAAERGGCQRIWSEDLNAGQKYFGSVVKCPFV